MAFGNSSSMRGSCQCFPPTAKIGVGWQCGASESNGQDWGIWGKSGGGGDRAGSLNGRSCTQYSWRRSCSFQSTGGFDGGTTERQKSWQWARRYESDKARRISGLGHELFFKIGTSHDGVYPLELCRSLARAQRTSSDLGEGLMLVRHSRAWAVCPITVMTPLLRSARHSSACRSTWPLFVHPALSSMTAAEPLNYRQSRRISRTLCFSPLSTWPRPATTRQHLACDVTQAVVPPSPCGPSLGPSSTSH